MIWLRSSSIIVPVTFLSLFFLFFLLLLLLFIPTIVTATVLMASGTLTFISLFFLCTLKTIKFLDLFSSHPKMTFTSSKAAWAPVEKGSSSFEIHNNLGSIDFAVVGWFVSFDKVFFGVKFDKAITSGFTLKITDDLHRFDDTVFLQMRCHLPRIRNSNLSQLFYSSIVPQAEFSRGQKWFCHLQRGSTLRSSFEFCPSFFLSVPW